MSQYGDGNFRLPLQPDFPDIDLACKGLEITGTDIRTGNQTDVPFLLAVAREKGPFDVVIDDGGQQMERQITSFKALWGAIRDRGFLSWRTPIPLIGPTLAGAGACRSFD